jgi:replication-associated recombination protein RarA
LPNPNMPTSLGLNAFEVVSSLQKNIRRGHALAAYYRALDLEQSGHGAWLNNRLRIVLEEDIGPADPFHYCAAHLALNSYLAAVEGPTRRKHWQLALYNAIAAMCKANPKTRDADCAYWAVKHEMLTQPPREIEPFALDHHTARGKAMGKTEENHGEVSYYLDHDATDPDLVQRLHAAERWAREEQATGRYGDLNPIDAKPGQVPRPPPRGQKRLEGLP